MTTLVVCLDRTDDVGRKTGLRSPIVGWEAVRALVTDVGLADPEDSGVNSLLESLRVAQSLRDEDEETVVAVVSGDRESMVSADRAVARQLDDLIAQYNPDSAVVVIDSAEDERLVPIVESRVRVDAVDRVVVRQARDIESTYYLLKQFLADEELRQTILVPIGLTLLVFPVLAMAFDFTPAQGAAAITTIIGLFLLYKGFSIDELLTGLAKGVRRALYAGQVSIVTYVVAVGLTLVGLFAGALGVSSLEDPEGVIVPATQFAFDSIPWLAMAALTASGGRLLDEIIREEPLRSSYLHLPFVVVSVGLVIRGFSGYFLEQQDVIGPLVVPNLDLGWVGWRSIESFDIGAGERLVMFVVAAILLTLIGVRVASYFSRTSIDHPGETDANDAARPRTETDAEVTDGGSKATPEAESAEEAVADGTLDRADSTADDASDGDDDTAAETADRGEEAGGDGAANEANDDSDGDEPSGTSADG